MVDLAVDAVARAAPVAERAVGVVAPAAPVVGLAVDLAVAAADARHRAADGHERPGAATKASYRSNVIGPLPVGR